MVVMMLLAAFVVFFLFCWLLYIRPFLFSLIRKELCCGQAPVKQKRKRNKLLDIQETK